jgi:hypothetical protein
MMKALSNISVRVLSGWPPYSPGLNIIEIIWAKVKNRVQGKNPKTIEKLKAVLCKVWNKLSFATINKLVADIFRTTGIPSTTFGRVQFVQFCVCPKLLHSIWVLSRIGEIEWTVRVETLLKCKVIDREQEIPHIHRLWIPVKFQIISRPLLWISHNSIENVFSRCLRNQSSTLEWTIWAKGIELSHS